MRSIIFKFLVIQLMLVLSGTGVAKALNVGDLAPDVILEGISVKGEPMVESISSSPGDTQSYTIIEFFETENAASKANLFPLFEISLDTEEFVATRLVAVNPEIADVKAFLANNKSDIRTPVHFDNRQNAMRAYGVTVVPTIFVLKDEKKVVFKHEGALTDDARTNLLKAVGY